MVQQGLVKQPQSLSLVRYFDENWGMPRTVWPWQQQQATSKSKRQYIAPPQLWNTWKIFIKLLE